VSSLPADAPLRIGVIGAGDAAPALEALAERVGEAVARAGAVLVSGGRGGVMAAACRGARRVSGITVGLLPGEDAREGNPWLVLPLPTGLGEARNVLVVRASEALVAIGGAWGTLSEIALAGALGRPLIVLAPPAAGDLGLPTESDPEVAVRRALGLARARRDIPYP
jgi:hypothetical protein